MLFASYNYIEEEWGKSVDESFEVKVDDLFTLLANYPEMGAVERVLAP